MLLLKEDSDREGDYMPTQLLQGNEFFYNSGNKSSFSLIDFWSWSSSDFSGNTLRGVLAEFLVAKALSIELNEPRKEWTAYDISYNRKGIEVKCSSYWQAWHYAKKPTLIYDISESNIWDPKNGYTGEIRRASDVYVFCLFGKETDRKIISDNTPLPDIMDIRNWSFYVASSKKINEVYKKQKKATLSSLKKHLNITELKFSEIKEAVDKALQE